MNCAHCFCWRYSLLHFPVDKCEKVLVHEHPARRASRKLRDKTWSRKIYVSQKVVQCFHGILLLSEWRGNLCLVFLECTSCQMFILRGNQYKLFGQIRNWPHCFLCYVRLPRSVNKSIGEESSQSTHRLFPCKLCLDLKWMGKEVCVLTLWSCLVKMESTSSVVMDAKAKVGY